MAVGTYARRTALIFSLLGARCTAFYIAPAALRARMSTPAAATTSERSAIPSGTAGVRFRKYQGLGNDFILVDNRHADEPMLSPEASAKLCDRHFGVGADGVIFALPAGAAMASSASGADYAMRIYNSDGSEPEMCGNGIRCLARFLADLEGRSTATYKIDTLAGLISPVLRPDGLVTVDMGEPILTGSEVPTTLPGDADGRVIDVPLESLGREWRFTCVSMGNPHAITFVDDLDQVNLKAVGPPLETNKVFPAKTNVEFVQVLNCSHLRMKVWERGAGATLACGTGACALLVAAVLNGLSERLATVTLPGGDLVIEWRESDNRCYMTGPAEAVFDGVAAASAVAAAAA